MIDFQTWLQSKGIDVQTLDRQLRAALVAQFEAERKAAEPPGVMLVLPADCLWPMRTYRSEVFG